MFNIKWLVRALSIPVFLPFFLSALEIDSSFIKATDSIFSNYQVDQATRVEVRNASHTQFMAFTVKTFNHPFAKVAGLLRHQGKYASMSKKLKQSELIDSTRTDTLTWFLVFGNWFAGSWFVGDVYEDYRSTADELIIINRMHHNKLWFDKYKKVAKGWMKVGYYDYRMWTRLKKMGENRTRVAMVSIVEPTVKIPIWLNKLASKKIFPGILNEVDEILTEGLE